MIRHHLRHPAFADTVQGTVPLAPPASERFPELREVGRGGGRAEK